MAPLIDIPAGDDSDDEDEPRRFIAPLDYIRGICLKSGGARFVRGGYLRHAVYVFVAACDGCSGRCPGL